MMAVDVSGGVSIQPVHDVLQLGVQPVDDRVEGHTVLGGKDDQLEVGVAHLREEHVDARSLLKTPAVFVLKQKQIFFDTSSWL